jgi:hypothetical protein
LAWNGEVYDYIRNKHCTDVDQNDNENDDHVVIVDVSTETISDTELVANLLRHEGLLEFSIELAIKDEVRRLCWL